MANDEKVKQAYKTLVKELRKRGDYYDELVTIVEGVFDDCGVVYLPFVVENDTELAQRIVDRLIGD